MNSLVLAVIVFLFSSLSLAMTSSELKRDQYIRLQQNVSDYMDLILIDGKFQDGFSHLIPGKFYFVCLRLDNESCVDINPKALQGSLFVGLPKLKQKKTESGRRLGGPLPGHGLLHAIAEGYQTVGDYLELITPNPFQGHSIKLASAERRVVQSSYGKSLYPIHLKEFEGNGRYAFGGFIMHGGKLCFHVFCSIAGAIQLEHGNQLITANYQRLYGKILDPGIVRVDYLGNNFLSGQYVWKLLSIEHARLLLKNLYESIGWPVRILGHDHEKIFAWNHSKHKKIYTFMPNDSLTGYVEEMANVLRNEGYSGARSSLLSVRGRNPISQYVWRKFYKKFNASKN